MPSHMETSCCPALVKMSWEETGCCMAVWRIKVYSVSQPPNATSYALPREKNERGYIETYTARASMVHWKAPTGDGVLKSYMKRARARGRCFCQLTKGKRHMSQPKHQIRILASDRSNRNWKCVMEIVEIVRCRPLCQKKKNHERIRQNKANY